MRTIRNLVWFVLAFGLTVWSGLASAQIMEYSYDNFLTFGDSKDEACIKAFALSHPSLVVQFPPSKNGGVCQAGVVRKSGLLERIKKPAEPPSCQAGEKGDYTWKYEYSPWGNPNDGGCDLKCEYEVKECFSRPNSSNPDQIYCTYPCAKTGNPKSSSDGADTSSDGKGADDKRDDVPPIDAPPNSQCPKGTVQVGVNSDGIPRCVGTGSEPKNSPPSPPKIEAEKEETSDDGTKTNTKTVTTTNSDGSKTTTTTVTITKPDGTKQTDQQKETTKTPLGSPGKDESKQDDEKYDLCKQNPNLAICRNSTVAGKCGEISCMGDAIQCATLRAAAAMQCQQQKDLEDIGKAPGLGLGNAIADGSDPMKGDIANALKGTEIDLSKPTLDATGFVGAGACLAPITMKVGAQSVTASFDSVCQNIQPLRYAVMACAYILVYLLVSRSILQG